MQIRAYQRESIDAVNAYMRAHADNACIVLPTGSGKSVVFAEMVREYLTQWPSTRICILAHTRELVRQNAEKLAVHWPEAPMGVYSAGLGYRDTQSPIIFASIQSVYRRAAEIGPLDLIFVDEAHRIPLAGEGVYRRFIAEAKAQTPHLRVIGFTATPYRLGPGMVVGPSYILNAIAYEAPIRQLIEEGYLCRLTSKATKAHAELGSVHVRGGEYRADELERAVTAGDLVERTAREIVDRCANRRAWLVFCAGIEHAHQISRALFALGVTAPVVSSETPREERDRHIRNHQTGKIPALVNVNVLSEGYDAPHIDAVIMLRPTKSAGLYYQFVGRGLRIHPRKQDCLVLDFAGNIAEHGPIDAIDVKGARPREPGAAPTKVCPTCDEIVLLSVMLCPSCGYQWESSAGDAPHDDKPTELAILSQPPERVPVDRVSYHRHEGKSGIPTLRVDYHCGLIVYREWIALSHDQTNYARYRAERWWQERSISLVPGSVEEALLWLSIDGNKLREPEAIWVRIAGKYPKIESYQWRTEDGTVHSRQASATN